MRRALLFGLTIIAGAIPSFGDIAFYSSQSAWIAAHTGIVSDDFGNALVANYNSFAYATYASSTGATVTSQARTLLLKNGTGSWAAESTSLYGPNYSADLGSGRYLTTYYSPNQDFSDGNVMFTGTQNEVLQNGIWVDDGTSNVHATYGWGDTQDDGRIVIAAPVNMTGVAFDLTAFLGGHNRAAQVTVTTTGGFSQTITPMLGYQQFSFFGFDAGSGDSIATITISSLWATISDFYGPAWTVNGNNRTRTLNGYYAYQDDYRLAVDNLSFGNYTSGGGPPVDPPPTGGGGEVPETASLFMTGAGLAALGLFYRKRR